MARYEAVKLKFGKYKGKTIGQLYETDVDYICWLATESFNNFIKNACLVFLSDKKIEQDKKTAERERQQKDVWRREFFAVNNIAYSNPERRGQYTVSMYIRPQHSFRVPGHPASRQKSYGIKISRMYRGNHMQFGGLKKATAQRIARENKTAGYSPKILKGGDIFDKNEVDF